MPLSRRSPLLLSLLSFQALAQEAPPAPTPEAATPAPVPVAASPAAPAPSVEVRENWDPQGRLVRRLTLDNGLLVEEVANTYDDAGHLTETRTIGGGRTTVEAQTWGADGVLASKTVTVDGVVAATETYTWADGRMSSRVRVADGRAETTRWTYDGAGNATLVETTGADGQLVARTVSDRAPAPPAPEAPIPITLTVTGGVDNDTDVQTTSISGGFALSRDPGDDRYDTDPLEVSAYGTYTLGVSKGEHTNDDLTAGFGLDYHHFLPRTTAFLFVAMERNPVANLDIDLEAAPVGLKYEIVPKGGVFWTDISFAPLWNFRSILIAAGESCDGAVVEVESHCATSDVRGSFRYRLGLEIGSFTLKDTVEYLPSLTPDADFVTALSEESVLRNTATASVKLTDRLSLSETLVFTRDMRLKEQVDCAATPEAWMCEGRSLKSGADISLDLSF